MAHCSERRDLALSDATTTYKIDFKDGSSSEFREGKHIVLNAEGKTIREEPFRNPFWWDEGGFSGVSERLTEPGHPWKCRGWNAGLIVGFSANHPAVKDTP